MHMSQHPGLIEPSLHGSFLSYHRGTSSWVQTVKNQRVARPGCVVAAPKPPNRIPAMFHKLDEAHADGHCRATVACMFYTIFPHWYFPVNLHHLRMDLFSFLFFCKSLLLLHSGRCNDCNAILLVIEQAMGTWNYESCIAPSQ